MSKYFIFLFLCGAVLLSSCGKQGTNGYIIQEQPAALYKLSPGNFPQFFDDMEWNSLQRALQRLLATAQLLHKKIQENPSPAELSRYIHANFEIYQAAGRKRDEVLQRKPREMLVTGYYEPVFAGALQKTDLFRW